MVGAPPQKFDFVYICEIFQFVLKNFQDSNLSRLPIDKE